MITLGVVDLETSIKFYHDGLGFPKMDSRSGVAFFTLNGNSLCLYPRDYLAADTAVSPEGSRFSGFVTAHNVADEAEVDQVIEQASVGQRWLSRRKRSLGASTPPTSETQTVTSRRSPTIPISG